MPVSRKLQTKAEYNFLLIGIVSQADSYRLCFFLNRSLKVSLRRISDFVSGGGLPQHGFALYYFNDDTRQLNWLLIANHCNEKKLIPSLSRFSHLLLIDKVHPLLQPEEITSIINATTSVDFVHILTPAKIKDADKIIEELELHLMKNNIWSNPSNID